MPPHPEPRLLKQLTVTHCQRKSSHGDLPSSSRPLGMNRLHCPCLQRHLHSLYLYCTGPCQGSMGCRPGRAGHQSPTGSWCDSTLHSLLSKEARKTHGSGRGQLGDSKTLVWIQLSLGVAMLENLTIKQTNEKKQTNGSNNSLGGIMFSPSSTDSVIFLVFRSFRWCMRRRPGRSGVDMVMERAWRRLVPLLPRPIG